MTRIRNIVTAPKYTNTHVFLRFDYIFTIQCLDSVFFLAKNVPTIPVTVIKSTVLVYTYVYTSRDRQTEKQTDRETHTKTDMEKNEKQIL